VTIEEQPTYLHAKLVGERTPNNLLRFLEEVHAACVKLDRSAVLLEMDLSGPSLDVGAIFSVIAQRSPEGAKLHKIAYVEDSMADPARARFAETVALNRGVNVRLFGDLDAARQWLLGA
jgi:hypothetical protein